MTRILVVEDSRTQAEAARHILESAGFIVDVAAEAEQALAILQHGSTDLIISDIIMPGLSGYDLCRRIKRDRRFAHIPVILLTSLSDPMDIIEGLEAGADNFVTKPYEADYLVARVTNLLETKRLRTEEKLTLGIEIMFLGKKFIINSDKEQILDLLITTFEDTVRANQQLRQSREDLSQSYAMMDALYALTDSLSRASTDGHVIRSATEGVASLPGVERCWIERAGEAPPGERRSDILPPRQKVDLNLVQDGDVLGLLSVVTRHAPSDLALTALAAAAEHISAAFHRVRLQQALRSRLRLSEEKYGMLMENASDAIFIIDHAGIIREINRAAEQLLREPRDRVLGQPFSRFYELDSPRIVGRPRTNSPRSARAAAARILAQGERIHVELSASVVEMDSSEALTLAIVRDVTERRAMEERLRRSEKMEAFGLIAGGIAHDFNNILAALLSHTSILQRIVEPGTRPAEVARQIREIIDRGKTLTRQLLDFSRREPPRMTAVDVNEVVESTAQILRRIVGREIQLQIDLEQPLMPVQAHTGSLEQVLMNLVLNARDAMPQGGTINIATRSRDVDVPLWHRHGVISPGRYVTLSVSDTGTGMSEAVLQKLFEPLFTTKPRGKGTGLGLAVVYRIANESDAHIVVDSVPEQGSTFTVFLPATVASEPAGENADAPTSMVNGG